MNIDFNRFHKRAIEIAKREGLFENNKQKIIAFVLDSKGRILTEGWNSYFKTHPLMKRAATSQGEEYKLYLHAEVAAITKLSYKQLGKQKGIVVIRLNHNFELMNAKPCKICASVIKDKDIHNIIHS